MTNARIVDRFLDHNQLNNNEGRRGVVKLCKLAAALGYKDPLYYGQLERGATLGDLLCFLEDNPGVIEAVVDWIKEQNVDEWRAELEGQLPSDSDDEEESEDDEA